MLLIAKNNKGASFLLLNIKICNKYAGNALLKVKNLSKLNKNSNKVWFGKGVQFCEKAIEKN